MYWISALIATSSIHPALYAISVRTVGISPRTSSSTVRYLSEVASCPPHGHSPRWGTHHRVWLIYLTAVGSFVLQVWDSASSRLLADLHRSAHIASVVPKKISRRQRLILKFLILLLYHYCLGLSSKALSSKKEQSTVPPMIS